MHSREYVSRFVVGTQLNAFVCGGHHRWSKLGVASMI